MARVKYENGSATFPEKNLVLDRGTVRIPQPPPRPRRIILVRHGQSEGNVDEGVYTRVADPKIGLTKRGMEEAVECGRTIREMIERDGADDWKVYFYASPYRRTLETLRNVAKAFGRSRIAGVREEPRLREQDFGASHPLKNASIMLVSSSLSIHIYELEYKCQAGCMEVLLLLNLSIN